MKQRVGDVKAMEVRDCSTKMLPALVRRNVDTSQAVLITDEFSGYIGIKRFRSHETVNHSVWYVEGDVHTNSIESFWALLKRSIIGQYHKVSLRHLPAYIDEFCYRHNLRKCVDAFDRTIIRAVETR